MEVEAKFSIPDEQTFQRLLEAPAVAGCRLGDVSVAHLHDRYLDTRERAILAGGYACRVRRVGNQHTATLKGLGSVSGAVHRRQEYEVELPAQLSPQQWPLSIARDLALRLGGDQPLSPLFAVEQVRYSRLLSKDGQLVAYANLDRVQLVLGDTVVAHFLEFEVELLPLNAETDLEAVCRDLEAAWGLAPQGRSKFERGLQALAIHGPPLEEPGLQPDDPMSEAGRKTLRFHFRRMLHHEPGTRLGEDIEALHDMRVATRRMRAAFRVFGEYYDPKAVRPYLKGLKRTGRALGAVRDLDVFQETDPGLSGHPARSAARQPRQPVGGPRRTARSGPPALDRLPGWQTVPPLCRALWPFCRDAGPRQPAAGLGGWRTAPLPRAPRRPGGRLSAAGRRPRLRRVGHGAPIRRGSGCTRCASPASGCATPWSSFARCWDPRPKTVIKEIVALQDHLGALQDAVVASDVLRDFFGRDGRAGGQPRRGSLPGGPAVGAPTPAGQPSPRPGRGSPAPRLARWWPAPSPFCRAREKGEGLDAGKSRSQPANCPRRSTNGSSPALQRRLYDLQKACWDAKIPSIIVFEGWDAAGKGTSINLLTSRLDPRGFKLYPIQAPRTFETHLPWLWRFWLKTAQLWRDGHL